MPGLRVFRSMRPPFVRRVKIGPSFAKLPLDALLSLTALRRALAGRYDAIHSHEEGGLIGIALSAMLGVPHLYDMHSSLPQQLTNFAFSRSTLVRRVFLAIERLMIRRSQAVIVICPSLEDTVREIDPAARVVLIENAPGSSEDHATPDEAARIRSRYRPAPGNAARAVHGHVRGVSGPRPAVRRHGHRQGRAARRAAAAGRRQAGSGSPGTEAGGGRRNRRRHDVCGRTAGRRHPGVSAGRRRARLAALPRHEHAAQDLPVPAFWPARSSRRGSSRTRRC